MCVTVTKVSESIQAGRVGVGDADLWGVAWVMGRVLPVCWRGSVAVMGGRDLGGVAATGRVDSDAKTI